MSPAPGGDLPSRARPNKYLRAPTLSPTRGPITPTPRVSETAKRVGPTCCKTTHSTARLLLPPTTLRMKKSFSRLSSPLAPSFSLLAVYRSPPPLIRRRSHGVERAQSRYTSRLSLPCYPEHLRAFFSFKFLAACITLCFALISVL
jgi:hypothetical protein